MSAFRTWLEAIQELLGDITDVIADPDMLGALRLWHRKGWAPSDAAAALQDTTRPLRCRMRLRGSDPGANT